LVSFCLKNITTYEYDKLGNIIKVKDPIETTTYKYDAENRLIKISTNTNEETSFKYDNNGNLLSEIQSNSSTLKVEKTRVLTYDNYNRLETVSENGKLLETNKYNSKGLRVEKQAAGKTTKYLYDGDDVLLELDGSNKVNAKKVNDVATSLKRSLDKFNTSSLGKNVYSNVNKNLANTTANNVKSNVVNNTRKNINNGTSSKTYTLPGDLNSPKCFTAGTLVKTELGNKEIQDIQVGDKVYARNVVTYDNCSFKPTNKITSVEIKGTDLEKQFIGDKYSRLDIKATTNNNEIINIEIQLRNEYNMIQRSTHLKGNITSYSFRDVSSTNQIQDLEYHLSKMYQES